LADRNNRSGGKVTTIQDVARHAGVSRMTVSRVINSDDSVREETRALVAASIKELRYTPNPAARNLAGAGPIHIGVYYTSSTSAYLSELLVGGLQQSSLSGCQLVLEHWEDPEIDRTALERLMEGGVDGLILPPPLCDSEKALAAIMSANIPAVLVTSGRPVRGFSSVSINDLEAAREMTRHLLGLGHRRIAFVTGHPSHSSSDQRFSGFMEAMHEAGLPVGADQIVQGFFSYRSGLQAAEQLFSGSFRPTAVFACNDEMAIAAITVAHRKNLQVPNDVSIAGFDDTAVATMSWPELTTVRRPIADMAREAVRLLIEQVRAKRAGKQVTPVKWQLDYTLIRRGSTGPVPAA